MQSFLEGAFAGLSGPATHLSLTLTHILHSHGASTTRALQTRRKAHGWRSVYEQSSADSQKSPRLEERLRAELCRSAEKPTAGGASTSRALQKRRKAHGWRSVYEQSSAEAQKSPRLEEQPAACASQRYAFKTQLHINTMQHVRISPAQDLHNPRTKTTMT